jgi:hypothetical protein
MVLLQLVVHKDIFSFMLCRFTYTAARRRLFRVCKALHAVFGWHTVNWMSLHHPVAMFERLTDRYGGLSPDCGWLSCHKIFVNALCAAQVAEEVHFAVDACDPLALSTAPCILGFHKLIIIKGFAWYKRLRELMQDPAFHSEEAGRYRFDPGSGCEFSCVLTMLRDFGLERVPVEQEKTYWAHWLVMDTEHYQEHLKELKVKLVAERARQQNPTLAGLRKKPHRTSDRWIGYPFE